VPPDDATADEVGPYQSLYRRFRPQNFSELRGQEHVALALKNAVRDERVSHAYLFSGPRGTGKTSTARILGKALNCTDLHDGEPCGRCDSCISITEGSSFDVHELDAASNNGVDAMRDLVGRASLATPGRWKVYIVDEVHMLSTAASNALLKTLEEPPSHVVFVLATTDPHKVLPTIRSRTQHFEFHLLSEETLSRLLEDVARDAHLELPSGALSSAVRRGRGSARDALSVLDQVAAAGVVDDDTDLLSRVITAIGDFDSEATIVGLDRAMRAGHDPQQLAVGLIEHLRAGFLSLASGGALPDGATTLPVDELEAVHALGLVRCVRALEVIGTALVTMRDSPEPRITLEVALIRLAHPEADAGPEALLERLERLERRLDGLAANPAPAHAAARPSLATEVAAPRQPAPSEGTAEAPATASAPPATASAPPASPPPADPTSPTSSRPALGAFRTAPEGGTHATPETAEPAPKPQPPQVDEKPPEASALSGEPAGVDPPAEATLPGEPVDDTPVAGASSSTGPAAVPSGATLPSRDELVLAWGDHVIQRLRPKVRAIFQIGHFVGTDGEVALLAVPNEAHLSHAQPLVGEVAAAMSSHFGRPVAVRLVTDSRPVQALPDEPAAEERAARAPATKAPMETDLGDPFPEIGEAFEEVGDPLEESEMPTGAMGIALAKDRLLQAFPGAEEVDRS
jgi:DNA polymerase-3 subunit gamma/tau